MLHSPKRRAVSMLHSPKRRVVSMLHSPKRRVGEGQLKQVLVLERVLNVVLQNPQTHVEAEMGEEHGKDQGVLQIIFNTFNKNIKKNFGFLSRFHLYKYIMRMRIIYIIIYMIFIH